VNDSPQRGEKYPHPVLHKRHFLDCREKGGVRFLRLNTGTSCHLKHEATYDNCKGLVGITWDLKEVSTFSLHVLKARLDTPTMPKMTLNTYI